MKLSKCEPYPLLAKIHFHWPPVDLRKAESGKAIQPH